MSLKINAIRFSDEPWGVSRHVACEAADITGAPDAIKAVLQVELFLTCGRDVTLRK
jgi:hypothetical protein